MPVAVPTLDIHGEPHIELGAFEAEGKAWTILIPAAKADQVLACAEDVDVLVVKNVDGQFQPATQSELERVGAQVDAALQARIPG